MVAHHELILPSNLCNPSVMCLSVVTNNLKTLYLHHHNPYGQLLIRVMTYHKEFSPINSHESSIRWLFEVTWQVKYIMSPLAADSWHQTRKAAYLSLETPTLKATWTFDRMSNAKLLENLIFPDLWPINLTVW